MKPALAKVIAISDLYLLRSCVDARRQPRQPADDPITRRAPSLRRPPRPRKRRVEHVGQLALLDQKEPPCP